MQLTFAQTLIKEMEENYDKIAGHFSRTRQRDWPEFESLRTLIEMPESAEKNAKIQLLDVGCGNGRLSDFTKKINPSCQYTGFDISERLLDQARIEHPHNKFVHGSMLELPFTDNEFNIVTAIASLQHIPSEKLRLKALQELYRVTSPHGTLFMTNWNLYQPQLQKHFVTGPDWDKGDALVPWKNDQGEVLAKRYYHGFKLEELDELLVKAGWKVVSNIFSEHNIVTVAQKAPSNLPHSALRASLPLLRGEN